MTDKVDSMKVHEFFAKYADTPMVLRFVPISFKDGGNMTLNDVYDQIKKLEDQMLPMRLEEEKLMKAGK